MQVNLKILCGSLAVLMPLFTHAEAIEGTPLPNASKICGPYGCERVPVPNIPQPRPIRKTDLSAGVKGLKLGMPEAQVHALLEAMTAASDGIYAPACKATDYGNSCIAIGHKMTYGKSEVAVIRMNFTSTGMDQLGLTLSMAGCNSANKTERHPKKQFDSLAASLTDQLGSPASASERRKVWVDEQSLLLLDIGTPEEGMNVYPGCASTKVLYMDRQKFEARLRSQQAKDKDL